MNTPIWKILRTIYEYSHMKIFTYYIEILPYEKFYVLYMNTPIWKILRTIYEYSHMKKFTSRRNILKRNYKKFRFQRRLKQFFGRNSQL